MTRPSRQQSGTFKNAEPGPAPALADGLDHRRHTSVLNGALKDILVGH